MDPGKTFSLSLKHETIASKLYTLVDNTSKLFHQICENLIGHSCRSWGSKSANPAPSQANYAPDRELFHYQKW